jgi:hypothetical protein
MGASRSIESFAASCRMAAAVNCFVTEPISKMASFGIGTSNSRLACP